MKPRRHRLGWSLQRRSRLERLQRSQIVYQQLLAQAARDQRGDGLAGIVFSRDRALQLYALLESYRQQVSDPAPLSLLYRATTEAHRTAYQELRQQFPDLELHWREEQDFRSDLLAIVAALNTRQLFFLVDDIIFLAPCALAPLAQQAGIHCVPSLRLGRNIRHNYPKDRPLTPPPLSETRLGGAPAITWRWEQGELDWAYPLSVDGHFFLRQEIQTLLQHSPFHAPNSLEKALQLFKPIYRPRLGLAHERSRIVNLPINRVQTENDNHAGEQHPEQLLQHWQQGLKIDLQALYGQDTHGVHQELPIRFIAR